MKVRKIIGFEFGDISLIEVWEFEPYWVVIILQPDLSIKGVSCISYEQASDLYHRCSKRFLEINMMN